MAAEIDRFSKLRQSLPRSASEYPGSVINTAIDLVQKACIEYEVEVPEVFFGLVEGIMPSLHNAAIIDMCKIIVEAHDRYSLYMLYKNFPQNKKLVEGMLDNIRTFVVDEVAMWAVKYNMGDIDAALAESRSFYSAYSERAASFKIRDQAKHVQMCTEFLNLMTQIKEVAKYVPSAE